MNEKSTYSWPYQELRGVIKLIQKNFRSKLLFLTLESIIRFYPVFVSFNQVQSNLSTIMINH